jgi:hypothetical protein
MSTVTTTDDADLDSLNDGELLAVVASATPAVRRLERETAALRTRQARAMRTLRARADAGVSQVTRKAIAERAGFSEAAVRQAIKNLDRREAAANK